MTSTHKFAAGDYVEWYDKANSEWYDGQIKSINADTGMCLLHWYVACALSHCAVRSGAPTALCVLRCVVLRRRRVGWNSNYDDKVHLSTLKPMPPNKCKPLLCAALCAALCSAHRAIATTHPSCVCV